MLKNILQCIWCIFAATFDLVYLVNGNGNVWVMSALTIIMTVCASFGMIEIRAEFIKKYDKEDDE